MDRGEYDLAENVASSGECTGLVPALNEPAGDANCRRLYHVTAVRRKRKR